MIIFRFSQAALLAGLCWLSSCGAPEPHPNVALVDEAQAAVIARLKDPDSANFKGVEVNSQRIVCGLVNARNSFGGYVGFSAFWYDPRTKVAFLYHSDQDWGGKGRDARLFKSKGCSIGSEEAKALKAADALDESNKRLGIERAESLRESL